MSAVPAANPWAREPEPLRPVRIVLEGEARPLAHAPNLLLFHYPSGRHTIVDTGQLGVTVEDVTPARTWTDGDVLLGDSGAVWVRHDSRWRNQRGGDAPDVAADEWLRLQLATVLRYQAGE